ncbi:2-oxo-4-hydroxy-4-carboxy-5-ureidoimidazoline decarboxylase [Actinokineospora sp. HBU206404]|uniref:2-oxo-4-hydroxy-4-carboxy-5-ureidoimidazoline decarboxylase n=1 Tax=Actinokineospora xionganensis TaxID=2684470 RepID=A0ABR7L7Y2_9PSEU|nr:2-oxo-4-hydroxy-4-carboxy-5-ureidoimidazoline decarboxylase [Actinokineospora xionganensis]
MWRFNDADPAGALEDLLACCSSRRWAGEMVVGRPYRDVTQLVERSDRVFRALAWDDLRHALDAHPRIGDRAVGENREAGWSRDEQAAAVGAGDELKQANVDYEDRFGHVFLICATGLTADAILAEARRRLRNDIAAEREEVRQELRKIAALRLVKLAEA